MSESSRNLRKRYVDHLNDRYKLTFLVNGTGHSSDECKVLEDFCSKYSKARPTKDHRLQPETKNKFNRHQENNYIVNHAVGDIILQENKKLSVNDEAQENVDSEVNENNLYDIDKMILDEKELRKRTF